MKSKRLWAFLLVAVANAAAAQAPGTDEAPQSPDEVDISPDKPNAPPSVPAAQAGGICFFAGVPPAEVTYTVIKKLKVGKGTYGGVKEILPKFAGYAQAVGADAIIGYAGSQRFGFWPWRMVHPVVRGTAVKWTSPPGKDCTALGGSTLATIMATDRPPTQ